MTRNIIVVLNDMRALIVFAFLLLLFVVLL